MTLTPKSDMATPSPLSDADRDEQLAMIFAELSDRISRGEAVDIQTVAREYPTFAEDLRELWGAVMMVDAIGSQLQRVDSHPSPGSSVELPAAIFELPARFGDFELLQEIGRGGMGIVYRARQISLNREVAIKMLLRGQMASEADEARFRQEAESAAQLHHPGIVPVHEVGDHEGRLFFSMQCIRGETLAQRLQRGLLEPRKAARILAQVARAVHYAHEQGVLHRDLKPSNILIDRHGNAHVSDFGLARRVTDAPSLTRTGAILGTPAYMSPEQASGKRAAVSAASDVYSIGTILYQMLTGRPPFQAASPVDVVLMLLEQEPVPPRVVNPKADRDLAMISLRCLQKPPDLRYATAADLANDLEAYLRDEPVSARSGHFTQILARWLRETHHAPILQNWGLLWMWHSLVLLLVCSLTEVLQLAGSTSRLSYFLLWTAGLGTWAAMFWWLRRRMGPVTFVERQIAHTWAASMISIGMLFPVEWMLGLDVLTLSPVLALVTAMIFLVKAGILSGAFYVQAAALFLTALPMAMFPRFAHFIYGVVAASCFFFPGLKYYRARARDEGDA